MGWLIRHLLAIAVLPFTVTVLIPGWIARRDGITLRAGDGPAELALQLLGLNAIYIPLLEEPFRAMRFGERYEEYRRHGPRLLPRIRPWTDFGREKPG